MGERDADEARRSSLFNAHITPIPAYGTKRLEIEYQERLQVEQGDAYFSIPLHPDVYHSQTAGKLSISLDLKSAHAIRDVQFVSKTYPMQISGRTDKGLQGKFQGSAVVLHRGLYAQVFARRSARQSGGAHVSRWSRPGLLRSIRAVEPSARDGSNHAPQRSRAVRHIAFHAVGKTGTQLSGTGSATAIAQARRPIQSTAL